MTAAIFIRTGSVSTGSEIYCRSPRSLVRGHYSGTGVSLYSRSRSTRLSLDAISQSDSPSSTGKPNPLRRVRSDTDLIGSEPRISCGARWLQPERSLAEVEEGDLAVAVEVAEEYSDGGKGKGRKSFGGSRGSGRDGDRGIGIYYQEMLRADPGNPLLLRNYGRFMHEVEGDFKKAEEYYGRAMLASPDDGEVMSLYGRLVWESQRDSERAEAYYKRAVEASPDDCYVLGSYAHFLWEAEEEEGDEGRKATSSPLVEAF